nr:hypothetical protein [Tanacetum cinerariifolium]
ACKEALNKKKLLLDTRSVCYKKIDQDSTHMVTASKVPMLKPGIETTIAPTSAKEKAQRRKHGFKVADGYANNEGKKILKEHWKEVFYEWALRNQENINKECSRRSVPVETLASSTLVSCDGISSYDWSDQAEEGLEVVEARLLVYTKNKTVYEEDIKVLKCLGYNVVLPPYTRKFMPPKPDLSFCGLEEFVNEPTVTKPVVETSKAKASADKPKVQLWATVKAKTVNGEVYLQALVDGKNVIITESTVRRDFQLEDAEGVDCLPNAAIFEQLTLTGKTKRKETELPHTSGPTTNIADKAANEEMDDCLERAVTTASSLEAKRDSGNINKIQYKVTLNEPSSIGTSLGNGPRCQETMRETIALTSLKRKVKKLKKKQRSRTHKIKRLYKVGLTARVDSSDEASLGEDAFKQERIIDDIDVDEGVTLVDETAKNQERSNNQEDAKMLFDVTDDLRALMENKSAKPEANKVVIQEPEQGTTTTTLIITTTATIVTAASTRPKAKGFVIHEQEQAPTPTISLQQPSQVKVQDKGKGKMVEPEPVKKLTKKDQLMLDKELAIKLQAEEKVEERLAKEKAQQIEEVNIALDDIQAKIDADYQLAQRLQAEEQEN